MPPKSKNAILINHNELGKSTLNPDEPNFYRELALPAANRAIPMVQALHDEAMEALAGWQKKGDRIVY